MSSYTSRTPYHTDDDLARMAKSAKASLAREAAYAAQAAERQTDPGDNALTVWANGITRERDKIALRIAENGGMDTFWGLYREDTGERVRAVLRDGKWGRYWMLLDENEKATGTFIPFRAGDGRGRKAKALGLTEKQEEAPAVATIEGTGTGLSGRAWATSRRIDGGFPENAVTFNG